jgi:hypothetical protein
MQNGAIWFPWIDAYINRDFEVDWYKVMEVFVSAKTRRADFGQFKEILVYQSH